MAIDIIISNDNSLNERIDIYDSTDYSLQDVSVSEINAVRFLFATNESLISVSKVGLLVENYEYIVNSGSFTMDEVTYSQGTVFVARQDFTLPTSGVEVSTTGYFSAYMPTTPSKVEYFSFSPSDLGEEGTKFSDNARRLRYEIYSTLYAPNTSCQAGTYIVKGDLGNSIKIDAENYYVGQVFNKSTTFTYGTIGNSRIVRYLNEGTFDFWTNANSSVIYQNYINSLSTSILNLSDEFKDNFIATHTNYSLPYIQSETASSYDFSAIQTSLDVIVNYYGVKNKIIK